MTNTAGAPGYPLSDEGALCAQTDPEAWFPDQGGENRCAKTICHRCPLLLRCRAYGIAHPELSGVWGGLSQQERRRAAKRLQGAA